MCDPARILVIDIGKTNAKLAMVDAATSTEIEVTTTPNVVLPGPPYPHMDVDGIWAFLLDRIRSMAARHAVDALIVTTHGATGALIDADGALALPVLDYEHDGPDRLAAAYDAVRPDFAETGSPRLAVGLNLGAQLFFLSRTFPEAFARSAHFVTYPQYWAFRLSGVAATEPTSLGCHTDLWDPQRRDFSTLVDSQGWRGLMAPVRPAGERLGTITAAVAEATGLDPVTPVFCGIHDSNASLVPHLTTRTAPFAVVSTGTWVISMAIGGTRTTLDPARDTLVNVSAFGEPVPSARFMGGREWSSLMRGHATAPTASDRAAVLAERSLLLPAVETGSGPFAGRTAFWTTPPERLSDGERAVVVSYYLALVTSVCLAEVGARGPTIIEGPFAANDDFCAMLGSATGRPVIRNLSGTGTSVGTARLIASASVATAADAATRPDAPDLAAYAADWQEAIREWGHRHVFHA